MCPAPGAGPRCRRWHRPRCSRGSTRRPRPCLRAARPAAGPPGRSARVVGSSCLRPPSSGSCRSRLTRRPRSANGAVVAAGAAALLDQPDFRDPGRSLERLGGVVEGQRGHRGGRHGLHLHAGSVGGPHRGGDHHTARVRLGVDGDLGAGHGDRMAEREELRSALQGQQAGDPGRLQRVTLRRPGEEPLDRGRLGDQDRLCHGHSIGHVLRSDVDHPGGSLPRVAHGWSLTRMTRTGVPASAVATPTGITARPSARAIVASRFEPRGPVGDATTPPFDRRSRTRANCTFSSGPVTSASRVARTSVRASPRPIIDRTAGRTNTSNETNTETGFPGNPKYGRPPRVPNAWGFPGCIATSTKSTSSPEPNAALTGSRSPTETPPEDTSTSTPSASVRTRARAAPSSGTRPSGTGTAPASSTQPWRVRALASGTRPGPSGVPGSTSSSPVDRIPTLARGIARTEPSPDDATSPRSAAKSRFPAGTSTSPARTSWPAGRTNRPGCTGARNSTRSASRIVCSRGTTASAPEGTTPPVGTATASPPPTSASAGDPIRTAPAGRRAAGRSGAAPATSAARPAYPSIAEEEKGGSSIGARTSSAATQRCARRRRGPRRRGARPRPRGATSRWPPRRPPGGSVRPWPRTPNRPGGRPARRRTGRCPRTPRSPRPRAMPRHPGPRRPRAAPGAQWRSGRPRRPPAGAAPPPRPGGTGGPGGPPRGSPPPGARRGYRRTMGGAGGPPGGCPPPCLRRRAGPRPPPPRRGPPGRRTTGPARSSCLPGRTFVGAAGSRGHQPGQDRQRDLLGRPGSDVEADGRLHPRGVHTELPQALQMRPRVAPAPHHADRPRPRDDQRGDMLGHQRCVVIGVHDVEDADRTELVRRTDHPPRRLLVVGRDPFGPWFHQHRVITEVHPPSEEPPRHRRGSQHDQRRAGGTGGLQEHFHRSELVLVGAEHRLPLLQHRRHVGRGGAVELGAPQGALEWAGPAQHQPLARPARWVAVDPDGRGHHPRLGGDRRRCLPMEGAAGHELQGVRQSGGDRLEGFDRATGATRQVQDQRRPDRPRDASREIGHRGGGPAGRAHRLGQPGHLAVDHGSGGLGRDVAGSQSRPAGGDHQHGRGGQLSERRLDPVPLVRNDLATHHVEPRGLERLGHRRPGQVRTGSLGHPVAHGQRRRCGPAHSAMLPAGRLVRQGAPAAVPGKAECPPMWNDGSVRDPLVDRFGRVATDLRVSVIDRCNFRCTYCMPAEGLPWFDREEILTADEIERLVRTLVASRIREVKLTGGEPTVRPDLPDIVARLRGIDDALELSLTTNGYLLDRLAGPLAEAGLDRVTISCDSLLRHRFAEMTRRDALGRVLSGLRSAAAAGLRPIKVNCVVIGGTNDDEAVGFAGLAREADVEVRFIEYMPLDAERRWERDKVVPSAVLRDRINAVHPLATVNGHGAQPATTFAFADGAPGRVGFIASVTEPFCETCNRIRITADGQLRTCLFSLDETDLRTPLRSGATDEDLDAVVREAVGEKWAGHRIDHPDFVRPGRSMSMIGG